MLPKIDKHMSQHFYSKFGIGESIMMPLPGVNDAIVIYDVIKLAPDIVNAQTTQDTPEVLRA
jgi:hypothetical protein